jgi:streptomycin 6-kinase
MTPQRVLPAIGMAVTVRHLGTDVAATIVELADSGRQVTVVTDEGDRITFALRTATGAFHAPGHGPRLLLRPLER